MCSVVFNWGIFLIQGSFSCACVLFPFTTLPWFLTWFKVFYSCWKIQQLTINFSFSPKYSNLLRTLFCAKILDVELVLALKTELLLYLDILMRFDCQVLLDKCIISLTVCVMEMKCKKKCQIYWKWCVYTYSQMFICCRKSIIRTPTERACSQICHMLQ